MNAAHRNEVVVAHSTSDTTLVEAIAARMNPEGVRLSLVRMDARTPDEVHADVTGQLQPGDAMVLFLSKEAFASPWFDNMLCGQLDRFARDRPVRILNVLLNGPDLPPNHPLLALAPIIDCRPIQPDQPDGQEETVSQILQWLRGEPGAGEEMIGLSFIVLAMTQDEARQLESGEGLIKSKMTSDDHAAIAQLKIQLKKFNIDQLSASYGEGREDWRVPADGDITVRQAIEGALDPVNTRRRNSRQPILRPRFFTNDYFSDDEDWSNKTWDYLNRSGCVAVIDVVSLFHPLVRERVKDLSGGARGRTSLVFVSLLHPDQAELFAEIEKPLADLRRSLRYHDNRIDVLCSKGVGGAARLKLGLESLVPRVVHLINTDYPQAERLDELRAQVAQGPSMARFIFSEPR